LQASEGGAMDDPDFDESAIAEFYVKDQRSKEPDDF
jgi:hypothetical protein